MFKNISYTVLGWNGKSKLLDFLAHYLIFTLWRCKLIIAIGLVHKLLHKSFFILISIFFTSQFDTALAQQQISSYEAFISDQDLYNSKGTRLTKVWQIIAQDRANYHTFKIRDEFDKFDNFFATKTKRAAIEKLVQKRNLDQRSSSAILNGNVLIRVNILSRNAVVDSVEIAILSDGRVDEMVGDLNFGIFGNSSIAMTAISTALGGLGDCDRVIYSYKHATNNEIILYLNCEGYEDGETFESGAIIRFNNYSGNLTLIDIQFAG